MRRVVEDLGHGDSLAREGWPQWREDALQRDVVTVVVQINGKLRGKLEVPADTSRETWSGLLWPSPISPGIWTD